MVRGDVDNGTGDGVGGPVPQENWEAGDPGVCAMEWGWGCVVVGGVRRSGGVIEDYMVECVANGVDGGVRAVDGGGVADKGGGYDRVDVTDAVEKAVVVDGWVGKAATDAHCVEGKNEVCAV